MTMFMAQEMVIKLLSSDYPLHELIFIRSIIGLFIILIVFVPLEGGINTFRTTKLKIHLLRSIGIVIANLTFYLGIASMSLAEATSIFFVAPIFITIFSAIFLREKVGARRWIAVVVGLFGVLLIIRPGAGLFQLSGLLPLSAAIAYATVQVSTRAVGRTEKASTMAFYLHVTFVIVCIAIAVGIGDGRYAGSGNRSLEFLLRAWVMPASTDLLLIGGVGFLMGFGVYLIFQGYRLSEPSLVAPFEYIGVPLAIFWGVLVFQDYPNMSLWFGATLIIGAGIYTIYRESVRDQKDTLSISTPKNR